MVNKFASEREQELKDSLKEVYDMAMNTIPTLISSTKIKSDTTLEITTNSGYIISLRIHRDQSSMKNKC